MKAKTQNKGIETHKKGILLYLPAQKSARN